MEIVLMQLATLTNYTMHLKIFSAGA